MGVSRPARTPGGDDTRPRTAPAPPPRPPFAAVWLAAPDLTSASAGEAIRALAPPGSGASVGVAAAAGLRYAVTAVAVDAVAREVDIDLGEPGGEAVHLRLRLVAIPPDTASGGATVVRVSPVAAHHRRPA